MFGNPVREAGIGGFIWRDQTILSEIKASSKSNFTPMLYRLATYLGTTLLAVISLLQTGMAALIAAAVLMAVVYFARLHKTFPQAETLYGAAVFTPLLVANEFNAKVLLLGIAGLAIVGILIKGEPLAIGSVAVASASGIEHSVIATLLTIVLTAGWVAYGVKTHHSTPLVPSLGKKNSLVSEPIRMPVGYHKAGTQELKKALRENNGHISARHRGSIAERTTALTLLGLPAGSAVYHDIDLPGADNANIDHLAITPYGVFVIDTKLFAGRVHQKSDGDVVKTSSYGEQSLAGITNQMLWAKSSVQAYLNGVEVKAIVALQKAQMDEVPVVAKDKKKGNVAYLPLDNCISIIQKFPVVLDEMQIKTVMEDAKAIVGERKPVYPKK